MAMNVFQLRGAVTPGGWTTGAPGEGLVPAGIYFCILGAY